MTAALVQFPGSLCRYLAKYGKQIHHRQLHRSELNSGQSTAVGEQRRVCSGQFLTKLPLTFVCLCHISAAAYQCGLRRYYSLSHPHFSFVEKTVSVYIDGLQGKFPFFPFHLPKDLPTGQLIGSISLFLVNRTLCFVLFFKSTCSYSVDIRYHNNEGIISNL